MIRSLSDRRKTPVHDATQGFAYGLNGGFQKQNPPLTLIRHIACGNLFVQKLVY